MRSDVHNENWKDKIGSECGQLIVELVSEEDRHDRLHHVTD